MGRSGKKPATGAESTALTSAGEPPSRPLVWMGSSKEDISGLPGPVKASFGHRLRLVQQGKPVSDAKALPVFGAGVVELRESFDSNAFRTVYVVSLRKAVYVLHAFTKKSKSGIALPKPDAALIELRLKRARALDAED
jgi:phage-related protein